MTVTTDDRPPCSHRWIRNDATTDRCPMCGATRTTGDRLEALLRTVRRDGTDATVSEARRRARRRR
ncbi:hypothetical protein CXY01_15170 [Cellulomonas xylanilytica]|uniref:Uncharacterized protein n=1 Tax=Cellulomonas xylanilytica TaxID=233583 RepID=A0A510V277_9CELL|nr:hypothetical protein CXY01_15170 [Cellulomonas xylanilytica]